MGTPNKWSNRKNKKKNLDPILMEYNGLKKERQLNEAQWGNTKPDLYARKRINKRIAELEEEYPELLI